MYVAVMSVAFSTTWLFVTIYPSSDITKPDPRDWTVLSEGCCCLGTLNGKLKKSSKDGCEFWFVLTVPVVEILTTEGDNLSARSENEFGPVKLWDTCAVEMSTII